MCVLAAYGCDRRSTSNNGVPGILYRQKLSGIFRAISRFSCILLYDIGATRLSNLDAPKHQANYCAHISIMSPDKLSGARALLLPAASVLRLSSPVFGACGYTCMGRYHHHGLLRQKAAKYDRKKIICKHETALALTA